MQKTLTSAPAGPGSDEGLSRREREIAFRKQWVLEAAETVFAERGFAAASVEEIAGRAEVALATLYKMFGSKEELFAALVEYRQDEFFRRVEEAVRAAQSPKEKLGAALGTVFRYFEEHEASFRVYLGATQGFPWHIRTGLGERAYARHQEFLGFLTEVVRAGMEDGTWHEEDAETLALAASGILHAFLTRRHTRPKTSSVEEEIERLEELVFRLFPAPGKKATSRRKRKR